MQICIYLTSTKCKYLPTFSHIIIDNKTKIIFFSALVTEFALPFDVLLKPLPLYIIERSKSSFGRQEIMLLLVTMCVSKLIIFPNKIFFFFS